IGPGKPPSTPLPTQHQLEPEFQPCRHSSQFIVSTSSIATIPSGLMDGVKAATKLSRGNILQRVDYFKYLVRRRSEMTENVEELKALIKHRVDTR
ncbi:hypothetical protein CROQUDRAFT_658650, partial [Cronartium quercuum f. sp. fusiforme G11]